MFCTNCGKENIDTAKFCIACGKEMRSISNEDEPKKKHNTLSGKDVLIIGIIWAVAIVLIILMCVVWENGKDSEGKQNSRDNQKEVINEQDKTNVQGPINEVGNTFANLGYQCGFISVRNTLSDTGRVTGQGDTVYFYEQGAICELDKNGKKSVVCWAENASSLNVVGNTLYYLQGGGIYSVNIKEGLVVELLKNVHGPFMVCDNYIYYVTSSNATATVYEYFINRYNLNGDVPQDSIYAGNKLPILAGVNPQNNDMVTYYFRTEDYEDPRYTALSYAQYSVVEANFNDTKTIRNYVAPVNGNNAFCFVLLADDYTYIFQCVEATYSYKYPFALNVTSNADGSMLKFIENINFGKIRNCYNNNLIISDWHDGTNGLYIIPYEEVLDYEEGINVIDSNLIIEENDTIYEVYVVGDYLYYTLDSYSDANVYRVKMDGTGWEDI